MNPVQTLADLAREAKDGPVTFEVDGARFVVQDEASYAKAEEDRFVASLIQGEADYKAGLGFTGEEARAELRRRLGF